MRHLFVLVFATSAVSAAPLPAEIARRHLASLRAPVDEMGTAQVTPVGRGWTARFRQQHAGLPVIGGELVVRIDENGKVLRHAGESFDLTGFDAKARVTAAQAIEAVRAKAPRIVVGGEIRSLLAIDPGAVGGPRLVWAVRPTPVPQLLENAIYLVDARSGQLLKRFDLLKYGKASVFVENPVDKAAPEARDFAAGFDPTNVDGYLENSLLKAYDCVDKGEIKEVGGLGFGNFMVHICTVTPSAKNAGFDYTAYQPQAEPLVAPANGCPGAPMSNDPNTLQPIDEFSEVHMYWHVADIYSFMRGLFADNNRNDFKLRAQPLAMAVNLCTPDFAGGLGGDLQGPLVPFDNAFFSPGQGNPISETLIQGQDAIMFGQGSKYDFAYDGDVIKHEFMHAVIDTLGKLVKGGDLDVWGLQDDQGAMNEGLSDYFSAVIAGNPELGDYAGRNIPDGMGAEGAIRNIDNQDQCGRDRWGEVHKDSEAFTASLWQARVAIAGDPKGSSFDAAKARLFDRAVLAALSSFGINVDMTQAANEIVDESGMLLPDADKAKVEAAFTAHKILPVCDRVIDYQTGDKKPLLGIDGTDSPYAPSGATRVPGYVQWKIDVPVGADSITAHVNVRTGGSFSGGGGLFGGGSAPKLELVVGPPGEPVQWVLKSSGGNEVASAPFSDDTGNVTATLSGLAPGLHYVMIVNAGGGAIGQNIYFDTGCTNPAGCAPDMAMAAPPDLGGGCNCEIGGNTSLSLAPLMLLAFALFVLRRRSVR